MIMEVKNAAKFVTGIIKERSSLTKEAIDNLETKIIDLLNERYENHWYPEKPMKGSAFRCMNISLEDNSIDTTLKSATAEVNLSSEELFKIFNKGLALWVDPNDVSCRLGKGAIFPIYKKITEKKSKPLNSNAPVFNSQQRRPQQRPRSTSPHHVQGADYFITKQRSLTPPGFSNDADQMQPRVIKPTYSGENLHKLWDSIPNSSVYPPPPVKPSYAVPTTHNMYVESTQKQFYNPSHYAPVYYENTYNDSSYSFNQYSSYYNRTASYWKNNEQYYMTQQKPMWQEEEAYQRYHWSRKDEFPNRMNNGSYLARQAQEVF